MPGFVLDGAAPDETLRWEGKYREGCFHPPLHLLSHSRSSSDLHLQFSMNYEKSPHNGIKSIPLLPPCLLFCFAIGERVGVCWFVTRGNKRHSCAK